MQFSFSLSETIKGLVFHLLLFAETLLCKPGVWGPIRAPEAVTFLTVKYAFSHFSFYLFFKSLTYIYAGTCTKYLFQYQASGYFDKFVLQNWFGLQIHWSVNQESVGPLQAPEAVTVFDLKICIFLLSRVISVELLKRFIQNIY